MNIPFEFWTPVNMPGSFFFCYVDYEDVYDGFMDDEDDWDDY